MAIFRTLHHQGREFVLRDLEAPDAGAAGARPRGRTAPGAGEIGVDAVAVSPPMIRTGEHITLTARARGRSIAFIFVESWLLDDATGTAVGPLHRQHLAAPETRETGGVARPVWGDEVDVRAEFFPVWTLLRAGDAAVPVSAAPERYGSADQEVRGVYTTAATGDAYDGRLIVDAAGTVQRLLLRPRSGGPRAARRAAFAAGDTFAPILRVLIPGADGAWSEGRCQAEAVTFTGQAFRLEAVPPSPGSYLAAAAVQDLDGGTHRGSARYGVTEA